jgi:glycosyltransferase involved in cell wall biosynthesis
VRVLQWAVPYFPTVGGRERFVQRLSSDLIARGHGVGVVCPYPPAHHGDIPEIQDITHFLMNPYLHLFEKDSEASRSQLESLFAFVEAHSFDVMHIHNHSSLDLEIASKVSAQFDLPVALTLHGPLEAAPNAGSGAIARLAFVDNFVAVSRFVFDRSLPHLAPGQELTLIANGVPLPNHRGLSHSEEFVYAGRLSPEKGIPQLLSAFKLFTSLNSEVCLRIIGSGPQDKLLRLMVDQLELKDRVFFEEWQDEFNLRERVARALAVFVPSLWEEPFGLSAAEAMANGTVVVHSNKGGLPEVVGPDGECGYSFENGDLVRLVSIMNELVRDRHKLTLMGRKARERAAIAHSHGRMVDQYLELYGSMTLGGAHA